MFLHINAENKKKPMRKLLEKKDKRVNSGPILAPFFPKFQQKRIFDKKQYSIFSVLIFLLPSCQKFKNLLTRFREKEKKDHFRPHFGLYLSKFLTNKKFRQKLTYDTIECSWYSTFTQKCLNNLMNRNHFYLTIL